MAAGSLCLVLGAGFLDDTRWQVNPDAVATAGAALAVQAEAGRDRLVIAVEGPLAGRLRDIARRSGGEAAADSLAASACPEGTSRVMVVDPAGRDLAEGEMHWPPAMADAGAGPAPEIARALREFAGLPVPRPLPPDQHPVDLLRLPGDTDEQALLAAAFASPWTSWITAGDRIWLATDAAEPPSGLAKAQRLGEGIALGRLRLLGPDLPDGARALDAWPGGRVAECPADCAAGEPWLARRFDRAGAGLGHAQPPHDDPGRPGTAGPSHPAKSE